MAAVGELKFGIVADDFTNVHVLRRMVTEAGHQIGSAKEFDGHETLDLSSAAVDAWIISLDLGTLEAKYPEQVEALLDSIRVPMMLNETRIPTPADTEYASWRRRMVDKIEDLAGTVRLTAHDYGRPNSVWVLAGSMGGPKAIKEFLTQLPPDLDIAFVYVNHIDSGAQDALAETMSKGTVYPAYTPSHGEVLHTNKVAVISAEFVTALKTNGTLTITKEAWTGFFKPNIDQVVASVTSAFGKDANVIVFSGMCDDGAAACRFVHQQGGQVWIQRPDTCVSAYMPNAALATKCVDFTGTPVELATKLVEWAQARNAKKPDRAERV